MKFILPQARFEAIVVQELRDEVLVCDTKNNRVFCLNQTAGEVWKLCDGKTDVSRISTVLSKQFRAKISEEIVLLALEQLSKENLLVHKISTTKLYNDVSRREVIKRIGLSSMIALPLVSSVVMPTAAQAQSGCSIVIPIAQGCPCSANDDCDAGLFCADDDTCQPPPTTPCDGDIGGCPVGGFCCPTRLFCCNPGIGDTCSGGC